MPSLPNEVRETRGSRLANFASPRSTWERYHAGRLVRRRVPMHRTRTLQRLCSLLRRDLTISPCTFLARPSEVCAHVPTTLAHERNADAQTHATNDATHKPLSLRKPCNIFDFCNAFDLPHDDTQHLAKTRTRNSLSETPQKFAEP